MALWAADRRLKAVVTGGAGFIGSHLVRRLASDGVETHVLMRPGGDAGHLQDLGRRIRITRLDLRDRDALRAVLAQAAPDVVYHLAVRTRRRGGDPLAEATDALHTDLAAFLSLLDALRARPPRMMIRAGTLAEYGDGPSPAREDQPVRPLEPYAASVAAATAFAEALGRSLSYPVVTARLALTYGPGQSEDFLIPGMIASMLDGRPVHVHHPAARRDLIHVDDVVESLLRLARVPQPHGTVLNIGSGVAPSMREAAQAVLRATGAPERLLTFGPPDSSGSPACLLCDSSLAAERLGWRASLPLPEGIARTVSVIRAQRLSSGVPA